MVFSRKAIITISIIALVGGAVLVFRSVTWPQQLAVISPIAGQVFHPGDTILVTVSPPNGFNIRSLHVLGGRLGIHNVFTAPFEVSILVPVGVIGPVDLLISVNHGIGPDIAESVRVFIEPSASVSLLRLRGDPAEARIPLIGMRQQIRALGDLSDGTTVDLSRSLSTSIDSGNPSVAGVEDGPQGKYVRGMGPGKTVVIISNGSLRARIDVLVQICELRGDLDCDGDVDQADLNLLLAARGNLVTGPDDPRDLNKDGRIDNLDAQILTTLCSRSQCATEDTTPPVTMAVLAPGPNANGWNNTNVVVNLRAEDNPGGSGVNHISVSLSGDQSGSSAVAGNSATVTITNKGTTVITYFATDKAGNQENAKTLTVRLDKSPPVISGLPAPGCTLWPPNHRLVQVATVTASDNLSGLAPGSFLVTATSNEPEAGLGDGDIARDVIITGGTVQLRAERAGAGTGRIYTLTATASDIAGNRAMTTATCTVPHDRRK